MRTLKMLKFVKKALKIIITALAFIVIAWCWLGMLCVFWVLDDMNPERD